MDTNIKNRVAIKVFIGFPLPVELKIQLNRSMEWKQDSIVAHQQEEFLEIVRYDEVEYIGRYLKHSMLTIKDLKEEAKVVREKLKTYLPEFALDDFQISLFPQVFVS